MSALKQIETVRNDFLAELEDVNEDLNKIESLRSKYLGRKGKVAALFSLMGEASNEERPALGESLNQLKKDIVCQNKPNLFTYYTGLLKILLNIETFHLFSKRLYPQSLCIGFF